MKSFLRTQKTQIVRATGQPVILKGVNLGGWLMMEGYILHSLNTPERKFKMDFLRALGTKALREFEKDFRDHFIQQEDIKAISELGFNCIRVPFHHHLVETTPYQYDKNGLVYLDRIVQWAQKYKIWVILDLHAACGAQNHDWHSDSLGKAQLWTKKSCQQRTFALWEFLGDRYQDKSWVAGYDLLNEAVVLDPRLLNQFYKELIRTIRRVDKNHILFVEGNTWATNLEALEEFDDDNLALSIHCYVPLDFTSNVVPHLSYPLRYQGIYWNKAYLEKVFRSYARLAKRRAVPIFVGEFGIHCRQGRYGEDRWLNDVLSCFKEFHFHWTYWTYKAIKNSVLPDGIFSFLENPPWVNRLGPHLGWDTYKYLWLGRRKDMIRSWQTDQFRANPEILNVLCRALD